MLFVSAHLGFHISLQIFAGTDLKQTFITQSWKKPRSDWITAHKPVYSCLASMEEGSLLGHVTSDFSSFLEMHLERQLDNSQGKGRSNFSLKKLPSQDCYQTSPKASTS